MPSYVSANFHKSLDGTRVTNYAQWRSREAFEAMFGIPQVIEHMKEPERISEKFKPYLYEVSFVDEVS
jgi:hypothetical protein